MYYPWCWLRCWLPPLSHCRPQKKWSRCPQRKEWHLIIILLNSMWLEAYTAKKTQQIFHQRKYNYKHPTELLLCDKIEMVSWKMFSWFFFLLTSQTWYCQQHKFFYSCTLLTFSSIHVCKVYSQICATNVIN